MTRKKVYIFNGKSRAAAYGIGTYITQLIGCLKDEKIEFGLINIYADGIEVTITEKEGYQIISIPTINFSNSRSRMYYARNIAYLLKEIIPYEKGIEYIFHLNFMNNPELVANLKRMFKCKVILVAHYSNWSFALLGDYDKLLRILAKRSKNRNYIEQKIANEVKEDTKMIAQCDKLICIAHHSLESFAHICRLDKKEIILINNALKDCFTPMDKEQRRVIRHKYHIPEEVPLMIFAGRLDEVKGIAYLIQAYKNVLDRHANARLLIAGDGSFNQWLKEAENVWSQITFTGRIEKDVLYELYQIADIGVVSSIYEEFGFVAIEMMMHQLPIIVTETGGLSEIVENEVSGLKVPIKNDGNHRKVDIDVLSTKILLLIDHPEYAKLIGQNGRERFLKKYELDIFRQKMLNLYRNI